jgi:phenylacetate-CoA ligase
VVSGMHRVGRRVRPAAIAAYHALPPSLRSAVATIRGFQLRRWRYGRETLQWVEEALERDGWSSAEWAHYQEERLGRVLHRAATQVPYYRDQWAIRRRQGDHSSWEILTNWPVLEKSAVRSAPRAFLADDCSRRRMFPEQTSGTTGTPLQLWWSRETVRRWYALYEARARRWYGVSRGDRWAILGGQLVVPQHAGRPPYWVWNASLHQLYLSAYHIHARTAEAYVDAIQRYHVRYLLGYPSALAALARWAPSEICGAARLAVVVTNAEPLMPRQRTIIEKAFACPARETYGMAEIVAAASECPAGAMHIWPEVGWIEAGAHGGTQLVCTGLLNEDMPLIRYRVGDSGRIALPGRCPCGRGLPRVAELEGRTDDILFAPDGRAVGRLDPVFKADLHIVEAQIIQDALDRVRVRYVPAAGHSPGDARAIVQDIHQRMGPVQVELEKVESIPRSANGKFRAVICNLYPDRLHDREDS